MTTLAEMIEGQMNAIRETAKQEAVAELRSEVLEHIKGVMDKMTALAGVFEGVEEVPAPVPTPKERPAKEAPKKSKSSTDLTVAEAAKYADVTPKTIYLAVEAGKLDAEERPASGRGIRGGKATFIKKADLDAWMDAR